MRFTDTELRKALDKILAFKPLTYQERDAWVRQNMNKGDDAFDALCHAAGGYIHDANSPHALLARAATLSPDTTTVYRGLNVAPEFTQQVLKEAKYLEPAATTSGVKAFADDFATGAMSLRYRWGNTELTDSLTLTLKGPAFPITRCARIDPDVHPGDSIHTETGCLELAGKEWCDGDELLFAADEHFVRGVYDVRLSKKQHKDVKARLFGMFEVPTETDLYELVGSWESGHVPITRESAVRAGKGDDE